MSDDGWQQPINPPPGDNGDEQPPAQPPTSPPTWGATPPGYVSPPPPPVNPNYVAPRGAVPPPGMAPPPHFGAAPPSGSDSKATTGMILGIVSIFGALCCPLLGIGLGIAGIVMGVNAGRRIAALNLSGAGQARAALICGVVGIVVGAMNAVLGAAIRLSNLPTN